VFSEVFFVATEQVLLDWRKLRRQECERSSNEFVVQLSRLLRHNWTLMKWAARANYDDFFLQLSNSSLPIHYPTLCEESWYDLCLTGNLSLSKKSEFARYRFPSKLIQPKLPRTSALANICSSNFHYHHLELTLNPFFLTSRHPGCSFY